MTNQNKNVHAKAFRDLDIETRVTELASLQIELNKPEPITRLRLNEWASTSADRHALLRGAVWGGIRWSKTLGKPKRPSIADGFTIVHEFKRIEFVDLGGGNYRDDSKYIVQAVPSVWDATKNPDEYRVGFFFIAGGGGINPNRLTVKLATVPWQNVSLILPGYRKLSPVGYSPFGNLGEWVVLPDFEVLHVPYHLGRYIEPLAPGLPLP
jgi:hypothetical protein